MPLRSLVSDVKLTQYASFDQGSDSIDHCPACQDEEISKTPRRSPALFHCRKCGFMANIDDLHGVRWMLGQRAV